DRAREVVEDHEMEVVAHALDDARERPDLDDEAGLFSNLARHRLRERLTALEPPARHRPQPFARRLGALDDEQALGLVKHERSYGDDRGPARFFAFTARLGLGSTTTNALGHSGASKHSSQLGRFAWQTRRPCQISRCAKTVHCSRGTSVMMSCSIFTGSVC